MRRYYCTYFDRNYLIKALGLIDSLNRCEDQPFTLFAVCLDEISRTLLTKLAPRNVVIVPLHKIEERDEQLAVARSNRTLVEYYWTLTPTVILRLLELHPEVDAITYLDADLYFYSSPTPVFREFDRHSILIHGHRFSPALAHLEAGNGTYNVGLLCFRRDKNGMAALTWWRDRCIEWCYHRSEDGKMGDQMYLNDWPQRFGEVRVLEHKGAGVAPWNHEQYAVGRSADGKVMIDEVPLVFYHFHAFFFVTPDIALPATHVHYPLPEEIITLCFLPYLHTLRKKIIDLVSILPGFSFGLMNPNILTTSHTFLCRTPHSKELAASAQLPAPVSLDEEWDCFVTPQFRHAPKKAKPEVKPLWTPGRPVKSCDDLFLELAGRPICSEIRTLYVVGAHLFQERDIFFRMFPRLETVCLFEPIPQLYEHLEKENRHDPRIRVFPYAIADTDCATEFHITDNHGESSSLLHLGKHKEIFPHVKEAITIPVQCRTIDTVIREHGLNHPDLLFIDVQGAEYKVLQALSPKLRSEIRLIYTEASTEELYVGARPLQDIRALLEDCFAFLGFAPLFNETPTHGNALFVNYRNAGAIGGDA